MPAFCLSVDISSFLQKKLNDNICFSSTKHADATKRHADQHKHGAANVHAARHWQPGRAAGAVQRTGTVALARLADSTGSHVPEQRKLRVGAAHHGQRVGLRHDHDAVGADAGQHAVYAARQPDDRRGVWRPDPESILPVCATIC